MTIDKSRRALLAFVIAISSVALFTPNQAAIAKPTIRADVRNHGIHWTPELCAPGAQIKRPASDPFADMLLG